MAIQFISSFVSTVVLNFPQIFIISNSYGMHNNQIYHFRVIVTSLLQSHFIIDWTKSFLTETFFFSSALDRLDGIPRFGIFLGNKFVHLVSKKFKLLQKKCGFILKYIKLGRTFKWLSILAYRRKRRTILKQWRKKMFLACMPQVKAVLYCFYQ